MKNLLLLVFFLNYILNSSVFGQGWERTYGGIGNDVARSVHQCSDSGFIMVGSELIRTDIAGNVLWSKGIHGQSVKETLDLGYVIVGTSTIGSLASNEVKLLKTNSNGDTLWFKLYGGNNYEYGMSVQETSDGGFIIGAYTASYGQGETDIYLIRTNASGDTLWTKTYGGYSWDYCSSAAQTNDGGYIITGVTYENGGGNPDIFLIKTDSNGNPVWKKTYGEADYDESAESLVQTSDGGYVIIGSIRNDAGNYLNYNAYLIKTNVNGDVLWEKKFGGMGRYLGNSVQQTNDGGYIITGGTDSVGNWDVFLIKTNGNGDAQLTKKFGKNHFDYGYSVHQTFDGWYIIAGITVDRSTRTDAYLIKTDSLGNICYPISLSQSLSICFGDSFIVGTNVYYSSGTYVDTLKTKYGGCDSIITTHLTVGQPTKFSGDFFSIDENQINSSGCDSLFISISEIGGKSSITIFPNPSLGIFTIKSSEPIYSITITNLIGEIIYTSFTIDFSQFTIDISSQPKGIYFLEIVSEGKREMQKIVLN